MTLKSKLTFQKAMSGWELVDGCARPNQNCHDTSNVYQSVWLHKYEHDASCLGIFTLHGQTLLIHRVVVSLRHKEERERGENVPFAIYDEKGKRKEKDYDGGESCCGFGDCSCCCEEGGETVLGRRKGVMKKASSPNSRGRPSDSPRPLVPLRGELLLPEA